MAQRPSGPRQGVNPPTGKALPPPRPVKYFEADGSLAAELLDSAAEKQARSLQNVTTTQLRRFYEDVLALDRRLQVESEGAGQEKREEVFKRMRAEFKMLKAKAAYAHGREAKQFPREFLQFFIDHVHAVNTAREFDAFCKHFQAVVAFHKFFGKNR